MLFWNIFGQFLTVLTLWLSVSLPYILSNTFSDIHPDISLVMLSDMSSIYILYTYIYILTNWQFSDIYIYIYIYIPTGLQTYGGFHKWGTPKWMVYSGQNPIDMDNLGVPHFRKPPLSWEDLRGIYPSPRDRRRAWDNIPNGFVWKWVPSKCGNHMESWIYNVGKTIISTIPQSPFL